MITSFICGGLGNQLFQLVTTIAYALRNNKNFWFLYVEKYLSNACERKSYWKTFFSSLEKDIYETPPVFIENIKGFNYIEKGFEYANIPNINNSNICLNGYFQSYKYFLDEFEIINKMLEIEKKRNIIIERFKKQNENILLFDFSKCVSIHFRMGDYKKYPLIHPICTEKYYINSLDFICEKSKSNDISFVLYFHENQLDEPEDIIAVHKIINTLEKKHPNILFIEVDNSGYCDWEQMILMSCCSNNIISNSTFSWWGAFINWFFLNRSTIINKDNSTLLWLLDLNNEKTIIYPDKWFGIGSNKKTDDLFPQNWVKINCY